MVMLEVAPAVSVVAEDRPAADTPVFVDPTGRRGVVARRLLAVAFAVAVAVLVGLVVAVVAVGHPDRCSVSTELHASGAGASDCRS